MGPSPVRYTLTSGGACSSRSRIAATASFVLGSVPTAVKRVSNRATCPSGLVRPALVCSSPRVGDSTWSTPGGASGPLSQRAEVFHERGGRPLGHRFPSPASTTTTALEGDTRSGKYFLTISLASRLGAEEGRKARWSLTATSSMLGATSVRSYGHHHPGGDDEPAEADGERA